MAPVSQPQREGCLCLAGAAGFVADAPTGEQERLLREPTWEISQVLFRLAKSLAPKLRFTEAAATWTVQVAFSERLVGSEPENAEFARNLSISHLTLGDIDRTLGQPETARDWFQKGLAIAERLAETASERADLAHDLSISYERLGDIEGRLGRPENARVWFQKGLAVDERLAKTAPENTHCEGSIN